MEFLAQGETARGNSASTRNTRLAAMKSFMRFVEYRVPALLEQSRRGLAIPTKKPPVPLVMHLPMTEMQALLDAPDVRPRLGIRERAMLHLGFAAGLRVSELLALPMSAVTFHPTPVVQVHGKGRRERALPLWKQTADDLRAWLAVRGNIALPEMFLSTHSHALTRMGFTHMLHKYVRLAERHCPSLQTKHVTPHVLRHNPAYLFMPSHFAKAGGALA